MPGILAAEIAIVLFALAWICKAKADRHTSPWWLGTYGSILAGFAALAFSSAAGGL